MRVFQYFIKKTIAASLAIGLVLAGCDIVEPPYLTGDGPGYGNGETVRTVLLEEFTGHQCPNCPEGSAMAQALKDFYGHRLVIVSIHAGFFAMPTGQPFNYDFRTPTGQELNSYFGITFNPVGMVNRSPVDGSHLIPPSGWGSAISQIVEQEPEVSIAINLNYQASNRQLQVSATTTLLQSLQGDYYLTLYLVEDGIIKPQKTNDPAYENGVIMDYEHKHVLRAAINHTWGEKILDGGGLPGEQLAGNWNITLDNEWNPANCSVVVFVYSGQDLSVLQAAKKKISF